MNVYSFIPYIIILFLLLQNPDFGTYESYNEAQQSIEHLQEEVRQMTVHITKTQAKLDALRQAGVDVSKWLQKAESSQGDRNSVAVNELTPNLCKLVSDEHVHVPARCRG